MCFGIQCCAVLHCCALCRALTLRPCCAVLQVAAHEAARIAEVGLQRLQAQKRLVLVLDLDHTLLNTGV